MNEPIIVLGGRGSGAGMIRKVYIPGGFRLEYEHTDGTVYAMSITNEGVRQHVITPEGKINEQR